MPRSTLRLPVCLALILAACGENSPETALGGPTFDKAPPPAGPGLVVVPSGTGQTQVWPFSSATLETPDDPINLVFTGAGSALAIRNALLGLDGQRGAPFPPVFPFDCTWTDAIGGLMAGYGARAGWTAAAIQLQCGDYGPIRFHLRLFDLGDVTIANAHFEVVIPGTADHQVLHWELAEQLVTYDMARTGLLGAPPSATGIITPAPGHRAIPAIIYDNLPADLRLLIGGPAPSGADVPIANDGRATVLLVAGQAAPAAPGGTRTFTINYDQIVPKPFCADGPADYVRVRGPVTLTQDISAPAGGPYRMTFQADGRLVITPLSGGDDLSAVVSEWQHVRATAQGFEVRGEQRQTLGNGQEAGAGRLTVDFAVGPEHPPRFERQVRCAGR